MKNKHEIKRNDYEITGNIVLLKLPKKDGSIVNCKIDPTDLRKVVDKGAWFAEWNKEFNNYLVKTEITTGNIKEKLNLDSFILDAHPKAPIRHFNEDTLDNRRSNIQVYDANSMNDYEELDSETISVILRDKYGREKARTNIDKEDLERVVNDKHSWVYYKKGTEHFAVMNSPEGRVFLQDYIMNTPQDKVTKFNDYNTLNNKKSNLIISSSEDEEQENTQI
ncbi:MAG: hypothetical protein K0R54_472 [Clostridiaceae bacterium]|jgi:hypothetical protein|nr:hypothetical protein [Clostridiaceae bacterium]